MSTYERTPLAIAKCLALVVAAFVLFIANFEWSTSRMVQEGFSITERDILVYDALAIIVAGYVIGLGAIAITRFIFPGSSTDIAKTSHIAAAGGLDRAATMSILTRVGSDQELQFGQTRQPLAGTMPDQSA